MSRILSGFSKRLRNALLFTLVICGNLSIANAFETRLETSADKDLKEAIQSASLVMAAQDNDVSSMLDVLAAARADYSQILSTLYRQGYYSGRISILVDGHEAADISPFATPAHINQIVLRVDPGTRFRFGNIGIAPIATNTELPAEFAKGEPAKSGVIAKATSTAITQWRKTGHAKAHVSGQDVIADHNANELDAHIRLQPGPVLRFGKMTITSDGNVKKERIRQIAGFPKGKTFSPDAINQVANRLRDTGTFRSVALTEAAEVSADGTLDIALELTEREPRRIGFGGEIYSSAGVSVSAYWMHRNIFGGAEKLEFRTEVAGIGGDVDGIDFRLQARLSRPGTYSPLNTFHIGAEIAELHEPTYTSQIAIIEAGMLRRFSRRADVSATLAYRYSDVYDDFGHRTFNHIGLSFTGLYDARDDLLNSKHGWYIEAEVAPYLGLMGSTSGARLYSEARGFYSVGTDDKVTFAGRLQVGSVLGSDMETTPPEMLFYAGGNNTVRGQPYQSLNIGIGPIETGGLSYLGLTAELRVEVSDKIGIVAFNDYGFVGSTSVPGSSGNWASGAGLGVRYKTGFGPIRLDIAFPTSGDADGGMQFYVGIGQAF